MSSFINPGLIEFEAPMQVEGSGAWIDFPYDLKTTYGKGNLVPVKITFDNRIEYRGSLAKMGRESAMVLIKKDIHEELGKKAGDLIQVKVELDEAPREVELHPEFASALTHHPEAKANYEAMAYTHRKEYARWVMEAKRDETRRERITKAIQMISQKQKWS
jgi:hypothetical protein